MKHLGDIANRGYNVSFFRRKSDAKNTQEQTARTGN